jgi:hypothetical protein
MTKVWAVMVHYDYEGSELIALYASRESAVSRVRAEAPDDPDYEWDEPGRADFTFERRRGATQYTAHEETVLDG